MRKRILAKDVHKKWLKDPAYREAYDSLAEEFALAAAVIEARSRAGAHPGGTGRTHGDHPAGGGTARKWPHTSLHPHPGTTGAGHRLPPYHSLEFA